MSIPALTQTTLSAAVTKSAQVIPVASATGISAPTNNIRQSLYVIGPGQARGELMTVVGVSGTQIQVSRLDKYKAHWPSGSLVLIGLLDNTVESFQTFDPPGASSSNLSSVSGGVQITPWVNIVTGAQWLWSGVLNCWVPGWNNPEPISVMDAVASTAGPVTPSGPLFHITGNSAITGFTRPIGFTHGSFQVIPDGTFTWTTGDGSIAISGTAVVNKLLIFTYDAGVSKWVPSYLS